MRTQSLRPALLLLLGLLIAPPRLPAQAPPPSDASGGEALRVVLLTMGNGDLVWEKFGHNALWIHDPVRGTDRVYNYGVFDFRSPGYWSRFVKGTWEYQIAEAELYPTMAQYQYLNRSVTAQELNLTPQQKRDLQAFLEWNVRPENEKYIYDYFRDNCSTRIRDALDRVLGGQIRAATDTVPTGTTYRWHSRRLLAGDPVTYTGLQAGLGPAADRPITAWEEMFLPAKLRQRVAAMQVMGPDGRRVPLVAEERPLFQAVGRAPEPDAPPSWIPRYLALGLALAGVVAGLGWAAARSRAARFGFAAAAGLWTLVMGIGGLLLLGLWTLTDHTIAYRNENLFQFSPLALPLVLLVPALALGARWAARPALWLSLAVAVSSLSGLLLQALPGLDQVNGDIIALVLPVNLAVAWSVWRLAAARGARRGAPARPDHDREPAAVLTRA